MVDLTHQDLLHLKEIITIHIEGSMALHVRMRDIGRPQKEIEDIDRGILNSYEVLEKITDSLDLNYKIDNGD